MSHLSQLNSYIAQLQQRLRLKAWLQGAAIFTVTALVVTIVLVIVLNQLAFPATGVTLSRFLILTALAAAAVFGIALPIMRLTQTRAVHHAEAVTPELEQRLSTFHERTNQPRADRESDPFLELLAADTLSHTQYAEPTLLIPDKRLFALGGGGLACMAVLVWMVAAGPGYLGYGASLLWTGPKKNTVPLYTLSITPGDVTVRRNSDQLITARITGMQPNKAQLFAHYRSAAGWEPVAMQRTPNSQPSSGTGATYQFVFAGLPENVEYYVGAGPLVSSHYKVRVIDLPSIKDVHVTYHYPAWTGLKPVTEEHSGDLRAIEGTDAVIKIETDHPLKAGQLVLDGGRTISLTAGAGNTYQGSIHMEKDGAYHLAANSEGQSVRLSEDYFIATDKAMPPEVSVARPGGDYRASPIEEITMSVKVADTFGLKDMHLHYSVNGGSDRDISLLKAPGAKSSEGSYTLPLEDFKLTPGDLVSVYATAKDGHSEARTDISFIQVDPFEREFSQSQQSGGGGGGGSGNGGQTEISKREKELIAATWKQQNDKTATPTSAGAQGEFLSEAQQKLRDQVNALSVRMQSRDISEANKEFTDFEKDMRTAATAMAPSSEKLKAMQWKDAIPLEQKALQALLRAEATFRQIQVAFGQSGGGGGGSGDNAGRDLASLFDLELDTAKNQYETAQSASPAEQRTKDIEDTLAKLDALAKRQEELANRQQNPQQSFQERWEQEMLRREAEQLQRQMEQLAQNGQQGGSQSQQSGKQQSPSSQSSSSQSGSPSSGRQNGGQSSDPSSSKSADQRTSDQRIEQALNRLRQANEAMKRGENAGQSTSAQQAAEQLRQASKLLGDTQQQLASGKLDSMTKEAEHLKQEQSVQAGRINKFVNQQNAQNPQDADSPPDLQAMLARRRELTQLSQERQQLSDGLSNLQKNLRDAAREMAPNQPGVAQSLRDALTEMDNSDLDNRVQRTADWLRRGIDPNTNGTEDQIAQGLAKLNEQLQQAQKGMGPAKQGQQRGSRSDQAALDQVERLRNQIQSMMQGNNKQANGLTGQDGQQRFGQNSRLSRGGQQPSQNGSEQGDRQATTGSGQPSQNQQVRSGGGGNQAAGDPANQNSGNRSGDIRNGGGGAADGTAWNNINTGNNRYAAPGQRPASSNDSANPPDTEANYRQSMSELNQLRQMVKDDPQAAKDVAELTRQMQHLDPSRFPGNPAMVEQMHQEILSSVNRLELQLQRDGISPEARTGTPRTIPAGYHDSVAEYYRRLSKQP